MKKSKLYAFLGIILFPTLLTCLLLSLFTQPTLELDTHQIFRPEDQVRPLKGFSCTIVDGVLAESNYSVNRGDGWGIQVMGAAGADPVAMEFPDPSDLTDSPLTLAEAKALIPPLWKAMIQELRSGHTVTLMLISPRTVNDSLLMQRKTDMTLSVSTKTLTPVESTYIGETDYGMIHAQIADKDLHAMVERYIMLIP